MLLPKALANAIVILVAFAWAVNFFLPIIMPSYQPVAYVHGIFTTIIGLAFGLSRYGKEPEKTPPGESYRE